MKLRMLVTCLTLTAASIAQAAQQTSGTSMQQDSQPGSMASAANIGDRTIRGCIRSKNGKYMLESKHHKMIWLTGSEDFAPHVGHIVTVHGSFLPAMEASSPGQGSDFRVKQIDMVADHCTETQKADKED